MHNKKQYEPAHLRSLAVALRCEIRLIESNNKTLDLLNSTNFSPAAKAANAERLKKLNDVAAVLDALVNKGMTVTAETPAREDLPLMPPAP